MEKYPRSLLMTSPRGFRVEYAINPHMVNAEGKLNKVDVERAQSQWQTIYNLYSQLGFKVETVEGQEAFPDMVFCANQTFPFIDKDGNAAIVLAQMNSKFRQGEVAFYEKWANKHGLKVYQIPIGPFEGCGDALWNFESNEVFGGYGFRTDISIYKYLGELIGRPIFPLQLVDERFYHLDTCLVILNKNTAAYVPEAFSEPSRQLLKEKFQDLIVISVDEAVNYFAGNAFCPDGKNLILQAGAKDFVAALKLRGFIIHEVETGEFMKSGGSVFCMKQQYWGVWELADGQTGKL